MWAQILCYKNQGIHWCHCNPTFLLKINFTLVRRLISALIWDISGIWNRSDSWDFREKRIDISRFLALCKHADTIWSILTPCPPPFYTLCVCHMQWVKTSKYFSAYHTFSICVIKCIAKICEFEIKATWSA